MKKLLLATAFIMVSHGASAEYLAKLNGRPISREEVEDSLAEVATMEDGKEPKFRSFPADFQRAFLDKHIEKLLIVDAAFKAGVDKDPEVVKEVTNYENNLIQQKYLTDLVLKQRTDKRMRDIYAEKFKSREGKTEIHASHILVGSEDEAKKIKAQLAKGADFDVLAEKHSIDPGAKLASGDLGFFTESEMVPEFSKAAFALKDGEISNPVKTSFGWHIIKVSERRKATAPSYDEALTELEDTLAAEVIDQEVERLKKSSRIEYLGNLIQKPAAVKPAVSAPAPAAPVKPSATVQKPAPAKPVVTPAKPAAVAPAKPAAPKPAAAVAPVKQPAQAPKPAVVNPAKPVVKNAPAPSAEPKEVSTSTNLNQKPKPVAIPSQLQQKPAAAPAVPLPSSPAIPGLEDLDKKPTVETNINTNKKN